MKKIDFWSILILLILPMFMACGSDDNKGASGDELVRQAIGTWMCTESTDSYQGNTVKGLQVGKEITFKDDGTYTSTSSSMGYSGTYVVNGNSITAKSSAGTFVLDAAINGNKMVLKGTASNGVSFNYVFTKE